MIEIEEKAKQGLKQFPSPQRVDAPTQCLDRPTNPGPSQTSGLMQQTGGFAIKDSGQRHQFASGSLRDVVTGKIEYSNVLHGPMFKRWAQHLTKAKAKYPDAELGVPNWTLISTQEEYYRYKESALRHFISWYLDEVDEDHASALYFNVNGVEFLKDKGVRG